MRRRPVLTVIVVLAAAAIAATTWAFLRPTYGDTVSSCQTALSAQFKASGKGKPEACQGVKEDDYSAILMNQIMGDEGWLDEDGRFDKNKMLEDTLNGEQ
ncbi:hypothetical protein [Streptomyces sp. NBC_00878]|uniref:hypothetical protein n=1 Tax=Streptomyces sp. NBC_00878 TaxID=2975854 RepID=UPI002257F4F4|nr:hypothetical protein [Streptomyces sp. NBC_00878]MCX4911840.1 hypothetical protein [Streptomyces sp. NBC_00878]